MRPDDRSRLRHMLDAIGRMRAFVAGRRPDDLETDPMLLFALVRALEVLGEAANGVTEATRRRGPEIPWPLIVATRNRLIHGYFDVDPELVWKTATEEAPAIEPAVRRLLEELG